MPYAFPKINSYACLHCAVVSVYLNLCVRLVYTYRSTCVSVLGGVGGGGGEEAAAPQYFQIAIFGYKASN